MRHPYLLALLLVAGLLPAQERSLTEREVKLEQRFIEAKREALLGKTEDAIGMFEALRDEQPRNDAIHFELARLRYAAGQTAAAIDDMRAAFELRGSEVYAAFLAELYQSSGRYRDGAELYATLLERVPGRSEFALEQAAFLVRAQDIKGAIKVYDELEKEIGVNPEISRHKHALYLGTGDTKRAERELERLVEAFPRQLSYRHLLAGYYASQGRNDAARKVYREILQIEPADVKAQLALQDAGGSGRPNAQADDRELLTLLSRSDLDLDLKIGKLLPLITQVANTGDRGLADRLLNLVEELRRVHPDAAKAAAIAGDLYYHTGRPREAITAYRETLALDDTVFPVWEQLLAALYLDNQHVVLREYAEEALDIFPNRPAVYLYYALAEALRGDAGAAENLLQQARMMAGSLPEVSRALDNLELAFSALADPAAAPADLDVAALPGGTEAPLATYLRMRETPERALALDHPENTNALLLELLGDAALEGGDKSAAAGFYRRARAAGSKSETLGKKIARVKS